MIVNAVKGIDTVIGIPLEGPLSVADSGQPDRFVISAAGKIQNLGSH